jgi:N-terminal domain on NACHT_NTPase and P-loop NTPases
MSGVEAILVLGVISSIISIVDGTKQVYDAATNAQGLPEAFREVAARLPIVQNILGAAKRHIEEGDADEDSYKGAKDVVEGCKKKARKLDELFQKVIPADSSSRVERYLSAVRTMGKGSQVETLMKGMLEDVQLLAINHGLTTVTDTQRKEVAEAIKEVAALPPSIPEHAIEGTGFTAIHSGSEPGSGRSI